MKTKFLYIYYILILSVIAFWDGIGVSIPIVLRLVFLGITFAPLFKWLELIPAVFVATLTITFSAFTYPLLPTTKYYYVILLLVLAFFSINPKKTLPSFIFLLYLVFFSFVDLYQQGRFSYVPTKILLILLTLFIIKGNGVKCREHMSYAFMMISIILSYWILLRPEAQMEAIHSMEGFEEVGSWTDPNYLGCIVTLGCVVAINQLLNIRVKGLKLAFSGATIVFSLFSMAFLASRGAIVALIAGSAVLILFSSRTNKSYKFLFILIMAIMLTFMFQSNYFDLAIARFQSDTMITGTSRTDIWSEKLYSFFYKCNIGEWLFGLSHDKGLILGNFGRERAFHNDFLAALVEYGFVGFLFFLYVFYYIVKNTPKDYRISVWGMVATYVSVCMTLEPTFSDMPSSVVFVFFLFYLLLFTKTKNAV